MDAQPPDDDRREQIGWCFYDWACTAFSTSVREAGDLSAGVYNAKGEMLAQAVTGTPGHVNAMADAVGHFIRRIGRQNMFEGDVYITNDPWEGTGHLHLSAVPGGAAAPPGLSPLRLLQGTGGSQRRGRVRRRQAPCRARLAPDGPRWACGQQS